MSETAKPQAAIFLDRDGTLNQELPHYIAKPEDIHLLEGAGQALRRLRAAGYLLVLITNQAGLGKGLMDEKDLKKVHDYLEDLLEAEGVKLEGIYFCGDHPEASAKNYRQDSQRRKPQPGMLHEAVEELNIDLSKSWMVGDQARDVQAGKKAGCRTILLVQPEESAEQEILVQETEDADFFAKNLVEAAEVIIQQDIGSGTAEKHAGYARLREKPTELDSRRLLSDILRELRHQRIAPAHREFSQGKMLAGMIQCTVFLCLVLAYVAFSYWSGSALFTCLMVALILQVMVVALLLLGRSN